MLYALDVDEHLVQCNSSPAEAGGSAGWWRKAAEFPAPAPDSLIRDDDAPFSQKQLDLPQAKAERRGREPVAVVRVGGGFMAASLDRLSPDYPNGLP
jgi:hypothetical protein